MDYKGQSGIGASMTALNGPCSAPTKVNEIGNEMAKMNDLLKALSESISRHETKIEPITRHPYPQPEGGKEEESLQTDFGRLLKDFNRQLLNQIQRIDDVTSRVQL